MVCPSCLEFYHNLLYDLALTPTLALTLVACNCPCDDLVEVEKPPLSVMALSYIVQALVVTIVGLNMGFRWRVGISYIGGADGKGTDYCEVRLTIILP
jgi:hypothetical protein